MLASWRDPLTVLIRCQELALRLANAARDHIRPDERSLLPTGVRRNRAHGVVGSREVIVPASILAGGVPVDQLRDRVDDGDVHLLDACRHRGGHPQR